VSTPVTFPAGGETCVGRLYGDAPGPADARKPCVVLCHGFGGTQDTPAFTATARDFVRAGYLALTLDYRRFGESSGLPRQLVNIADQLDDIAAAVGHARTHPGVDPDRIVLWGTSLGGGHVVTAAARDPRIAAVIAQIPYNGFPRKVEGRSTAATLRLLAVMVRDATRGALGLSPVYINQVGPAGETAVIAGARAQQTVDAMTSATWRNEVAPRSLWDMWRYRPGAHASFVRAPLLVCLGANDAETPAEKAAELARRAPRGELRTYDHAHFEFYRDDVRRRVTADQLAFLARVLPR
jgi:hypothetical protein